MSAVVLRFESQELLSQLQVSGLGVYETASRVPEGVETRSAKFTRNLQPIQCRIQQLPPQHIGLQRLDQQIHWKKICREKAPVAVAGTVPPRRPCLLS